MQAYIGEVIEQFAWELAGVLAPATAALVGGAGVAVLVTRLAPRWFGVLGVLLGIAAVLVGFTGGFLSKSPSTVATDLST